MVTGLAWTELGGEILTIESVLLPGKGNIKHTGKLGDVMQESVSAALSYVRSRSISFGIQPTLFEKRDIHVPRAGGGDSEGRPVRRRGDGDQPGQHPGPAFGAP